MLTELILAYNTFAWLTLYVYLHLIVSLQIRLQTPVSSSTRSLLMCGHGSLTRLPGSVCVCTVQALRCCRVHQRLSCQLFSSFPSGETLRGPSQKGQPPPKGGRTKTEGSVTPAGTFSILTLVTSSLFAKALCLPAVCCRFLKMYLSWAVPNAGNQRQSPHLHSKEAKSHLRVRHRTQPQTERRTEGSIQGARDHSTRWEDSFAARAACSVTDN